MSQIEAGAIGERIAKARKEAGMTQEDVADLATFSKRSLQDYESGATQQYKHLREISAILGRPIEWFLHGDPEPATTPAPVDGEQLRQLVREEVSAGALAAIAISGRGRGGMPTRPGRALCGCRIGSA